MANQTESKTPRQPTEVRMTFDGAWQPAPKRDWQGTIRCTEAVVGISFICVKGHTEWAKSDVGNDEGLEVRVMLGNYDASELDVQVNVSIGHNGPRWRTRIDSASYLPALLVPKVFLTGRIIDFAKIKGDPVVAFKAFFLARRDVRVGRNRLWHLRKELVECFPASLRRILTHGRSGKFDGAL